MHEKKEKVNRRQKKKEIKQKRVCSNHQTNTTIDLEHHLSNLRK